MSKRLNSLIIVLSAAIMVFACGAFVNAETIASGNLGENYTSITWSLDDSGTLLVQGDGQVEIGEPYSTYYTEIPWFSYRNNIKKVVLKNIKSTSTGMFLEHDALEEVWLENVKKIGISTFLNCKKIKSVHIDGDVELIDFGAFVHCEGLEYVEIPSSVKEIRQSFCNCTGLKEVKISTDTDYDLPFQYCTELKKITFTGNGTIKKTGCTYFEDVIIEDGVKIIGDMAFNNCVSLSTITIPKSVEEIGVSSFEKCSGLSNVIVPQNVKKIGNYAFRDCNGIKKAVFEGDAPSTFGNDVFLNCDASFEINYYPEKSGWEVPLWKGYKCLPICTHSLKEIDRKEPTCISAGNIKHYKCEKCNALFEDEQGNTYISENDVIIPVNKNAHNWDDCYTIDKWPTDEEDGYESIHCSKCDATKDERVIDKDDNREKIYLNSEWEIKDSQNEDDLVVGDIVLDKTDYVKDEYGKIINIKPNETKSIDAREELLTDSGIKFYQITESGKKELTEVDSSLSFTWKKRGKTIESDELSLNMPDDIENLGWWSCAVKDSDGSIIMIYKCGLNGDTGITINYPKFVYKEEKVSFSADSKYNLSADYSYVWYDSDWDEIGIGKTLSNYIIPSEKSTFYGGYVYCKLLYKGEEFGNEGATYYVVDEELGNLHDGFNIQHKENASNVELYKFIPERTARYEFDKPEDISVLICDSNRQWTGEDKVGAYKIDYCDLVAGKTYYIIIPPYEGSAGNNYFLNNRNMTCSHSYGSHDGICDNCGEDISKHIHNLTNVSAKSATCTTDGNTAYWYCSDCEKYYSDAEGKNEITKGSWIIKGTHNYQHYEHGGGYMSNGEAYDRCSVCGNTINHRVIEGYSTSYVKSFKVSKGKGSFTAKWKKQNKKTQKLFSGYQVRWSTDPGMSGAGYRNVGRGKASVKIKGAKKTRYYVQVRTYTGGYYSPWSAVKSVVTK